MNPATVTIHAGICGFTTRATATSDDDQMVSFGVESDCDHIKRLATLLEPIDAYAALGAGFEASIDPAAKPALKRCCTGCIIPTGLFKAMQVAAKLALPKDISICFEQAAD